MCSHHFLLNLSFVIRVISLSVLWCPFPLTHLPSALVWIHGIFTQFRTSKVVMLGMVSSIWYRHKSPPQGPASSLRKTNRRIRLLRRTNSRIWIAEVSCPSKLVTLERVHFPFDFSSVMRRVVNSINGTFCSSLSAYVQYMLSYILACVWHPSYFPMLMLVFP